MLPAMKYRDRVLAEFWREHGRAKDAVDERIQRCVECSEATDLILNVIASALRDQSRAVCCHRVAHSN